MSFLKLCGCSRATGDDEPSDPPRQTNNNAAAPDSNRRQSLPKIPQVAAPESEIESEKEPPVVVTNGPAKPPAAKTTTTTTTSPSSLPSLAEELWDQAYNNLRDGPESKLVREYEKLLSRDLAQGEENSETVTTTTTASSLEGVENTIRQDDPEARRAQMRDVIKVGLKKTEKQAESKRVMGAILGGLNPVTDIISVAISSQPQAAIPWAVVTTALKLLENPVAESAANRTGIAYVIRRMDWYWNLSGVLLNKKNVLNNGPSEGLRDILAGDLIDLYQQLLSYQMKTALSCYSSQTLNFLKDLVKSNDWSGTLTAIQEAEKKFREGQREILDWITRIDYSPRQSDHFEKRNEGTGLWLMKSDEFQTWLRESGKALLYHGIPGAGKTILTSVVVEELGTRYYTDNTVGIAYLYCEFNQEDSLQPVDLFLSVLKQLTEGLHFIPAELEDLYNRRRNERPTFSDVLAMLRSIISQYSRVFIFVDALDECPVAHGNRRDFLLASLLPNIFLLQDECGANIFATSREIPEIMDAFDRKECTSLPIRASDDDIRLFLESQMRSLHPIVLSRPALQEKIKNRIVEAAQGMFLLAKLHLDSLKGLGSAKKITTALDNLSAGLEKLDNVYDSALQRIDNQTTDDQTLAKRALSWITLSKRQLSMSEVDHAVAVEIGTTEFDTDNLSGIEYISSVCAGLVTLDESSNQIRLVHYTTYDYLKRTLSSWYPIGEAEMARNCVTYLSFDVFATGRCAKREDVEERLKVHALYGYAADNWGYHVRASSIDREELIVEFLETEPKVSACIQAMEGRRTVPDQDEQNPTDAIGLHLAANYGLNEAISSLVKKWHGTALEARESFDRTPLIVAAENGHEEVVKLLVDLGADKEAQDNDERTPLYVAAEGGHEAVVKLLLEMGADKDGVEGQRLTPFGVAVEECHWAVASLLLENGANPEGTTYEYGRTALLLAADRGNAEMVKQILAKGANPNATECDYGWTALTKAVENGSYDVVRVLLEHGGIDIEGYDAYLDGTALFIAARAGNEEMIKLLLEHGANGQAETMGGDTLLEEAAENGHEEMVKQLLDKYAQQSQ